MKSSFVLCFTYRERKCSIQICSSKRQNSGSSRSISLASEGTCVPKFTEVFLSHKWRQGKTGIWAGTGTVAAWKVIVFAHSGCKCPNACKYDCSLVSFSLNTNCRYIRTLTHHTHTHTHTHTTHTHTHTHAHTHTHTTHTHTHYTHTHTLTHTHTHTHTHHTHTHTHYTHTHTHTLHTHTHTHTHYIPYLLRVLWDLL